MKIGDKVKVKESLIDDKIKLLNFRDIEDYPKSEQQEDSLIFTIIDIYGRSSVGFICKCQCGNIIKDYADCHLELI